MNLHESKRCIVEIYL